MIVNLTDNGYDLIFQPAHGLLAAKLAQAWHFDKSPQYFLELLTATAQHDNNQRSFRGKHHLTEAGAPKGFTTSSGESEIGDLSQPKETLRDAFFQGRYPALLVSMHFSELYEPKRGEDKTLDAFLDEQQSNQRAWRKDLGLTKGEAEHDYKLLLWCDRCSLILCQEQVPTGDRKLEVQETPDGQDSYIYMANDKLCVSPWVFEQEQFSVSAEVHKLEQLSFESDEQLLSAIEASNVRYKHWHFSKE